MAEYNIAQAGTMPAELYDQQQQLNRQQQMAAMLMQNNQQPQGQMISGRYVAPSWAQSLQPVANMLAGAYISKQGDEKARELAKALKTQYSDELHQFNELLAKNPSEAYSYASQAYHPKLQEVGLKKMLPEEFTLSKGQKRLMTMPDGTTKELAAGEQDLHNVNGNLVDAKGNIIFKAPKEYAPHAPQLVQTANGFVSYNPNNGSVTPIQSPAGMGAPGGALMPPLPSHLQGEASSINQQKSTINDALKTVEVNKDAFGPKFAAPGVIAGEYGTSRMNEKIPSSQVEARAKVFNIASSVIKERAGTAQSAGEKEIIMRFLPSPFDGQKAITDKLNAFNDYLESKEKGISPVIGAVPAYRPNSTQTPTPTQNKPQQTPGSWGKATVVGG
jgi:hypothetical protein